LASADQSSNVSYNGVIIIIKTHELCEYLKLLLFYYLCVALMFAYYLFFGDFSCMVGLSSIELYYQKPNGFCIMLELLFAFLG